MYTPQATMDAAGYNNCTWLEEGILLAGCYEQGQEGAATSPMAALSFMYDDESNNFKKREFHGKAERETPIGIPHADALWTRTDEELHNFQRGPVHDGVRERNHPVGRRYQQALSPPVRYVLDHLEPA